MNEKKGPELQHVNIAACHHISAHEIEVELRKVAEAEMDAMWSFVGKKAQQRW